ncbi:MAG: glycoside hydrolase [Tannerella sp.]|jgi:hypothetical protein|nr:glycoside hydrolase [Tannerella sp.]
MKYVFLSVAFVLCTVTCLAQDAFTSAQRAGWLRKAEASKPVLTETVKKPVRIVKSVANSKAFQGWEVVESGSINDFYANSIRAQSGVVIDFGEHLTGYFTCSLALHNSSDSDAPVRLRFTFGETPAEIAVPFEPYTGGLSRAWLQDEVITVDYVPYRIAIPRRVAFRYLKIEVLAHSSFDFKIDDMTVTAQTSAASKPAPLAASTPSLMAGIDRVGLATLKECMQTVYEDGTKRDLRLWIGDLYLEALANSYSYKNHALTKRCLYLFAGLAAQSGLLHSAVFDRPEPHPQTGQHILDYALLYNSALLDYLKTTSDKETALDLWPVAVKQVEIAKTYIGEDMMYNDKPIWIFFDWKDHFDRKASLQGLFVKTFKDTYELAELLGKEKEAAGLPDFIKRLVKAARSNMYDPKSGLMLSGKDRQTSYLSQAWMTLGGVFTTKEAQRALKAALADPNAVYPGSPYATHFLIEAMLACGMTQEAKEYLTTYWGDMVRKGADTFWEVYDPHNDFASPYNFYPVNSYCHAWSCTPVYFIRKYPEIFQQ